MKTQKMNKSLCSVEHKNKPVFIEISLNVFYLVVEDDEDDFPTTRSDGDFLHNTNGNKEKCK